MSLIHIIDEREDEYLVKIFADGIKAEIVLSRAGYRVFVTVVQAHQSDQLTDEIADSENLIWFDSGLSDAKLDMAKDL